MNALPVHSLVLVAYAKRKGIPRESVRPSHPQSAIIAERKVSCPPSSPLYDAVSLPISPGHVTQECTNPRAMDWTGVPDKTPDEAWALLTKADEKRDLDDFRQVGRSL